MSRWAHAPDPISRVPCVSVSPLQTPSSLYPQPSPGGEGGPALPVDEVLRRRSSVCRYFLLIHLAPSSRSTFSAGEGKKDSRDPSLCGRLRPALEKAKDEGFSSPTTSWSPPSAGEGKKDDPPLYGRLRPALEKAKGRVQGFSPHPPLRGPPSPLERAKGRSHFVRSLATLITHREKQKGAIL